MVVAGVSVLPDLTLLTLDLTLRTCPIPASQIPLYLQMPLNVNLSYNCDGLQEVHITHISVMLVRCLCTLVVNVYNIFVSNICICMVWKK